MNICTILVETHPRYIPTKFEENPANGFEKEVKNVIVDGRTATTIMTDDGRKAMTKAQLTDKSADLKNHWRMTIGTHLVETHPNYIPSKFKYGFGK